MRDLSHQVSRDGDVVLGDDWVAPDSTASSEMRARRERRGLLSLRKSPLTRKIIIYNLSAMALLVAGIMLLSSPRDSFVEQRQQALTGQAELIADIFEVQLPASAPVNLTTGDGIDVEATVDALTLHNGVEVFVFDPSEVLIATKLSPAPDTSEAQQGPPTYLTDGLNRLWRTVSSPWSTVATNVDTDAEAQLRQVLAKAMQGETQFSAPFSTAEGLVLGVVTPILQSGQAVGVIGLTSAPGEVDALVNGKREQELQIFLIAIFVSIGLSLFVASYIANPLSDLAAAAELGRDRNARKVNPGRIRIPDLTARPDEIGRLSGALRGMISALYNRIDGNEQFAADVAHEIKNPLASLRSAVGTLRMVKRDDQREKLLDVIEHDVRRLDRLVSDISNASRLDSELVKEEEEPFNLLEMLNNLGQYLGEDAKSKGIEFITDLPPEPIEVHGLEARLAQVFVNLITNAISFCEDGDAIRLWVRKRENRVLVVVEDTGPGIPDQALSKIFKRFYSQRPEEHFGNNSGLGLAISKQIVEAHGGVIWAENIRPTEADITSEQLGARFVVGLPV